MARRFLVIGVVLALVVLFSVDTADAGRLGGAYRGPYGDDVTKTEEDTSASVGEEKTSDGPSADTGRTDSGDSGGSSGDGGVAGGSSGDSGDSGDGGASSGDGGASSGDGDSGGSGDGGAAAPPPTSDGGGSGDGGSSGGTTAPTAPPTTSSPGMSMPGTETKGKVAVIDQQAFWTFWFEHNKEWILAELLKAKATRTSVAPGSGGWYFSGAVANRSLTPVTTKQKSDKILPALKEAVTHKHSWVRDAAVLAMGKYGTEEVLPYLTARVQNDGDPQVVEDALLALGLTGEKKALNPLLKVLKGPAVGHRKEFAALGLALLGNDAAVSVLTEQFKAAVKTHHDDLASVLAIAIGRFRLDSVVPDLGRALKVSKRASLKVHVCQALGQIGGDGSRDMLMRALGDKNGDVKAAAVLALSRIPDEKVVGKLLGKDGIGSGRIQVKAYACVALGRIGRDLPDSASKLKKKIARELKDAAEGPQKNIYAAMYASLGLGIMGDASANDFFATSLGKKARQKNRDENNSAMAMAAGLLDMSSAVSSLRDISKGGVDQDFQGYACLALAVMGDSPSKDAITKTMQRNSRKRDVLRSGCWALGLIGDEGDLDMLIEYLKLDDGPMKEVRGAAAIAIGLIGDGKAVDRLVEIATKDPVGSNRAFAIVALGCLIDKDPVPRIPQLFENVHYRKRCTVVKDAMLNL